MPITYTPLRNFPGLSGLEEEIEKDFGKTGLETLKKGNLKLMVNHRDVSGTTPIPEVSWRKTEIKPSGKRIGGKCYSLAINHKDVLGYLVNGIVESKLQDGSLYSRVKIDLITEKKEIIRFAFNYT